MPASALSVDLYELTMAESYLAEGLADRTATFELACRQLPDGWGYLLVAGVEAVVDTLEQMRFSDDDLAFLGSTRLFGDRLLDRLSRFRFAGDVRAMPEGTAAFPGVPIVAVTGPVLEAQIVETAVLNAVHLETLIASKAARCVDAARGRRLVDFSLRRTHGPEAGLRVARSSRLAGFDATSNVLAGRRFGIPIAGTMAHSYVEAFGNEEAAFEAFLRSYPEDSTLLVDTYDTVEGTRRAAAAAMALAERGGRLGAIRLDSGDLAVLSRLARAELDAAGLGDVGIFASGSLDEGEIGYLLEAGAPIDGFGVGTKLGVSADAPFLDMAYKLVEFDGRPVLKLSPGKETLPGRKQAWRRRDRGGFTGDLVTLAGDAGPPGTEPLLEPVMVRGERVTACDLEGARARALAQRESLGEDLRSGRDAYPVEFASTVLTLRDRAAAEARRRNPGLTDREPSD